MERWILELSRAKNPIRLLVCLLRWLQFVSLEMCELHVQAEQFFGTKQVEKKGRVLCKIQNADKICIPSDFYGLQCLPRLCKYFIESDFGVTLQTCLNKGLAGLWL